MSNQRWTWDYLNQTEFVVTVLNDLCPIKHWPFALRKLLSKPTINNKERYGLFCFLYGNGVPPSFFVPQVLLPRCRDRDAVRHVEWLKNNVKKYVHRWRFFDIAMRRSEYLTGAKAPRRYEYKY